MKAGLLVKIIDPSDTLYGLDMMVSKVKCFGNIGKMGVILSEYDHRTATGGLTWYTVLIEGTPLHFREDYLVIA